MSAHPARDLGGALEPFAGQVYFAKECHEAAHETWTETECNAKKADCFAACIATDAGADTATDTGAETATDAGAETTTDAAAETATDASSADGASDAAADGG